MEALIKKIGLLGWLFGTGDYVREVEDSQRLNQLKASLDPENNMRIYYSNVSGYFNSTIDKVKKDCGIK